MSIQTIDIIFGSLILLFIVRSGLKGFVEEILSMASLIVGILAAILLFRQGAVLLSRWIDSPVIPELISFAGIFLAAFLLMKILEGILCGIVERIHLDGLNRGLGMVLGLVEGVLFVTLILFVLSVQPLFDEGDLLNGSLFARYLLPLVTSGDLIPRILPSLAAGA